MIGKEQMKLLRCQLLLVLVIAALVGLLTSCASTAPRKVSHAGFSVVTPHDWHDETGDDPDCLKVSNFWGGAFFNVEKLPGTANSDIAFYRYQLGYGKGDSTRTEESISTWYQFKGHGVEFCLRDKHGGEIHEMVFFFPEGELSGWYITAFSNTIEESKMEFEQVVQSFKTSRKAKAKGVTP
jgi:hypothetical protein